MEPRAAHAGRGLTLNWGVSRHLQGLRHGLIEPAFRVQLGRRLGPGSLLRRRHPRKRHSTAPDRRGLL